jgi:hypothetical protein
MQFFKYLLVSLLSLIVSLSSISESSAYNVEAHRHQKSIQDGIDDELPKNYPVSPFVIKNLPSKANLNIDGQGKATIFLLIPNKSLKDLDKATAIAIFGELQSIREDDPCDTFHVLTVHPMQGPNIFHIDVVFNQQQFLSKYRVRGFGISKPEWQEVI